MINLLPPELQQTYIYGRRNHKLRRWLISASFGVLGALLLAIAGVVVIRLSTNNYTSQIATTTDQLQKQNLAGVQKQVTTISNNLKLTAQVLSKEILFSDLLKRLGAVTPSNVILTNLAISQTQGAIDITAETTNYNAATQLQVNLADPTNQIFAKADIVSIACSNNANNPTYPCTATLRALFATNNPFLFTNTGKKAS